MLPDLELRMIRDIRKFLPGIVLSGALLIGAPALAQGKTSQQCGHEFDQCQTACNADHKDDAGKRAPCVAKCSGLYAACDAGVAYDKAKPWIEEQAKKTKNFFDELMKEYAPKKEPVPPAPKKPKSI